MTEIIYFDIDGTLRDEQKGIPESAQSAIRQCHNNHIYIALATGRSLFSIQQDVWRTEPDAVISGGGCRIAFGKRILRDEHFSELLLSDLLDYFSPCAYGISIEGRHGIYMNQGMASRYLEERRVLIQESDYPVTEDAIFYRDNFAERNVSDPIHKLCIVGDTEKLGAGKAIFASKCSLVQDRPGYGARYMEWLPAGCSKGSAVELLNAELHIPRSNSLSFGDGENDFDLLTATGESVAMATAGKSLREIASSVCEPPAQNGICNELLRRGIIKLENKKERTWL